nr:hypothetical protein [Tanacetum cinerariifolium]
KNVLLDYNHFQNIALVKKRLHETFMHMLVDALVAAFQALPLPDYVPGPEELEQAPPSPVYIPYVPELVYLEYIPPEDDVFPAEEQPLPAAASPTAESPGYICESDPDEDLKEDDDEDPEEDPADYLANHDDEEEEEEPSGDDANEEDKEQDKDDDDEEEEHPASADSIPPPTALHVTARISFRPQPPTLVDRPEVTLPPQKRLSIVHCPGYEAGESSIAAVVRLIEDLRDVVEEEALTTIEGVNTRGRQTEIFQRVEALVDDSQYHYETGRLVDQEARCSREAWGHLATALGEIRALQAREQARAGAPEYASSST